MNDGLPSSELFDITQDTLGRIWYATSSGAGYYDGYSFTNLTIEDSLADNSIVRIFHGKNGKLWFLSYSGEFYYYRKGKIVPFEKNEKIFRLGNIKNLPRTKWVDTLDNIWFLSNKPHKIYRIAPGNKLFSADTNLLEYMGHALLFFDDRNNKNHFEKYCQLIDRVNSIQYFKKAEKINFVAFSDRYATADFYILNKPKHVYLINDRYYTMDNNHKMKPLKENSTVYDEQLFYGLVNSYTEPDGKIWIRISNDGVFRYSIENVEEKPDHFFKNLRVTRILRDKNGNYWVATDGNGLFLIPSFDFDVLNIESGIPNENIMSFAIRKNKLYFSTNDNNIYEARISKGKVTGFRLFLPHNMDNYGRNILCQSDGSVWVITSRFLKYDSLGTRFPLNVIIRNKLYQALELHNHRVVIASVSGFFEYMDNKIIYDSREDGFDKHIRAIFEDKNNTLWLGTMEGLWVYKNKSYTFAGSKSPILKGRITAITETGNNLVVGTHNKGIVILGDQVYHLNTHNGLKSNFIKTLFAENDSTLWAGTNNGLEKIIFSGKQKNFHPHIQHFSVWDGLPSNEINEIGIHNNYLWIATNNGLASIDIRQLKKIKYPPVVFMEYIVINEKDTLNPEHLSLKYNQNNINFFYKGVGYNGPGNIQYKIKLKGIDNNWVVTKNTSARYTGLPAGDYTFLVKATGSSGVWSEEIKSLTFTINKHFTETWWFILILIVIVLMILTGIFLIILKNQRIKAENKRKLLQSEQKALRAQMNPHFIFNSLNSIQYLVLEKNFKEAAAYLSAFASLIRRVLENSKFNTIPLAEEIKTIELYLKLEKQRFEDKFDYKIIIDKDIRQERFAVPPMLIQPYIENAIRHGFILKKTKGLLIVKIEKNENNKIKIIIKDNGIGREEAKRYAQRKKYHKPTGMKNTKERIELINKIYKTDIQVKIIDLYDENSQAKGTQVELIITEITNA